MPGRVVDGKGQLVNGKAARGRPCFVHIGGFERVQRIAEGIGGVQIDLAAGFAPQGGNRAHMVIMPVRKQNMRKGRTLLRQRLFVGVRLGGGVDQNAVLLFGHKQKRVGIQRCCAQNVLNLHTITPFSSRRYQLQW